MEGPAGTSTGDGCDEAVYEGRFECNGDPTTPPDGPVIKFDVVGNCDAPRAGTGTFCFYSPWPPSNDPNPTDNLWVKYGAGDCSGNLSGDLPTCEGPTPVVPASWGAVKALF